MSKPTNYILLLAAGFTRNWGGYLAADIPGKLMGSMFFDDELRRVLEKHRSNGGFEAALDEVQQDYRRSGSNADLDRLTRFEKAITGTFLTMNERLHDERFNWQQDKHRTLTAFLVKFDAIFTLNYDTLLESHYLNSGNIELADFARWQGAQLPGIKRRPTEYLGVAARNVAWCEPSGDHTISARLQPYFKLHGSSNWEVAAGKRLIIAGGQKTFGIHQFPVLEWYKEQFASYLSKPNTKLMVIGYGFSDKHINDAIEAAASAGQLQLLIIDTRGLDAMSPPNRGAIGGPSPLQQALTPHVRQIHTRYLPEIFGNNVAHGDLLEFFQL